MRFKIVATRTPPMQLGDHSSDRPTWFCGSAHPIPYPLGLHSQLLEEAGEVVVAFVSNRDAALLALLDNLDAGG